MIKLTSYFHAAVLFLLAACASTDDDLNKDADELTLPELQANPAANKTLYISSHGDIMKVDPQSGNASMFFRFQDVGVSSMYAHGNRLYVGARDNSVNAISIPDAKLLWDVPLLEYEQSVLSNPKIVIKDNVIYSIGKPGVLVAVDVTSGKIKWEHPLNPYGYSEGTYWAHTIPIVHSQYVVVGTFADADNNYLHVINSTTGKRVWRKEFTDDVVRHVKASDGQLFLSLRDKLSVVDLQTGNEKWSYKGFGSGPNVSAPVLKDDIVLINASDGLSSGKLICLDKTNGTVRWKLNAGISYAWGNSPVVVDKYVFNIDEHGSSFDQYSSTFGKVYVADIVTGKQLWKNDEVFAVSSPVYANGSLFFLGYNPDSKLNIDDRSGLICIDATTGKMRWHVPGFSTTDYCPPIVVADNGVFRGSVYQD